MTSSITGALAGGSGLPAIPMYLADSKNETALATKFANTDGDTKAAIVQFKKAAPTLSTAADLMKNYQALKLVLTSFNMQDEIQYPALIKQLLTQDPTSATSTAQKIGNSDYLRFAKAMNQYTTNPFTDSTNLDAIVSSYSQNSYETAQGKQIPGMQQALAFKRQASQVTSVDQLIANPTLLKVAVTSTGVNYNSFGQMGYAQQVSMLTKSIKMADLQDPAKVDRMAETYLIDAGQDATNWGAADATVYNDASLFGATTTTSVSSLFGSSSSSSSSVLDMFA